MEFLAYAAQVGGILLITLAFVLAIIAYPRRPW